MIHVVRHADARKRSEWDAPDHLRPLSGKGRKQAELISERLCGIGSARIVSSPFARCVETMHPLARIAGVPIEENGALAEASDPAEVRRLLERLEPNSVVCSHGDVIEGLIGSLHAEGVPLDAPPSCPKASTWILETTGGRFSRARFLARPNV